jgi:hypothetical protein
MTLRISLNVKNDIAKAKSGDPNLMQTNANLSRISGFCGCGWKAIGLSRLITIKND